MLQLPSMSWTDGGMASHNSRIVGLEAYLQAAHDNQAASMAKLTQNQYLARLAADLLGAAPPGPSLLDRISFRLGTPLQEDGAPLALERFSAILCSRAIEDAITQELCADAVPKYGLSAKAMQMDHPRAACTASWICSPAVRAPTSTAAEWTSVWASVASNPAAQSARHSGAVLWRSHLAWAREEHNHSTLVGVGWRAAQYCVLCAERQPGFRTQQVLLCPRRVPRTSREL